MSIPTMIADATCMQIAMYMCSPIHMNSVCSSVLTYRANVGVICIQVVYYCIVYTGEIYLVSYDWPIVLNIVKPIKYTLDNTNITSSTYLISMEAANVTIAHLDHDISTIRCRNDIEYLPLVLC